MTSYIKSDFRRCKVEDFDFEGEEHDLSEEFKEQIKKRICPDTSLLGDHL